MIDESSLNAALEKHQSRLEGILSARAEEHRSSLVRLEKDVGDKIVASEARTATRLTEFNERIRAIESADKIRASESVATVESTGHAMIARFHDVVEGFRAERASDQAAANEASDLQAERYRETKAQNDRILAGLDYQNARARARSELHLEDEATKALAAVEAQAARDAFEKRMMFWAKLAATATPLLAAAGTGIVYLISQFP